MKTTVYCPGPEYSSKKKKFKQLLRQLDIDWCGNMREYIWKGPGITILAHFEREDDVTKEATFEIEGTPIKVNQITNYITENMSGRVEIPLKGKERDLSIWDIINPEPTRELPQYRKAPEGLISAHHTEWKRKREEYINKLEGEK